MKRSENGKFSQVNFFGKNIRGVAKFTFLGIGLFILLFLILFLPNGKSNPDTGITNCTNLTTAGERYNLSNDIYNNQIADACINIFSPNAIFNCNGHYIFSIQNYSGVYVNATNVTVNGCNITTGSGGNAGAKGIYFNGASNGTIFNNSIFGDSYAGIYLYYSNNSNITLNNAASNSSYGIFSFYSNNSLLTNNTGASNSGWGIMIYSSSNNTLIFNTGISNSSSGIHVISTSAGNNLTSNIGTSNSGWGIIIQSSQHNILTNNIGTTNQGADIDKSGIYLSSASNNTLISNIGLSNTSYGIFLSASSNNTLISNIGLSNTSYGIYLFGPLNKNLLINNTGTSNNSIGIFLTSSDSNNTLINNTGISNSALGYDGIRISGSCNNNILTNNFGVGKVGSGIAIYTSLNNTLTSNTGTSTSLYGIYLSASSNNTLVFNAGQSNSSYGISISTSSNNILTSNTGISNSSGGIVFSQASNNNLTSNTGISNSSSGIYFTASSNNTLISNTGISNSSAGIYLSLSNNNTINNSISSNNKYGLYISNSNGTIVSNLTAKNNSLYGIFLEGGSSNNVIKNSFIQLNNGSAFALNNTGIAPQTNYFYNNYFNNSLQYSNISTSSTNFFNITKTFGTNIVGGTYLAGNYWAAPNGSGFSQTCTASTDGICDTSYNFDGINYDYLPLTCIELWSCGAWSTCSNSKQTRTCSDANLCQTYKTKPSESQSCTMADLGGHVAQSSGGGGGSSFSSPIVNITPDKPVEITINNPSMDLNSLIINVKKEVSNSSAVIKKLDYKTTLLITGLPIGKLYQAFEIEPGMSNSNIINATLNFKINKTWLAENNITFHYKGDRFWLLENDIVGNIIIYRNPDGTNIWMPLATNYSYQDNQSYHLYAYSPGFSTFAIFLNKYDCLPNSARCDNNQVQLCLGNSTWLVTEHCQYGCGDRKCAESFFVSEQFKFLSIVIVAAVVIIGLILIFYKKRRGKRNERKVHLASNKIVGRKGKKKRRKENRKHKRVRKRKK